MTRKPNIWKFLIGIAVIGVMFVGTWATTSVQLKKGKNLTKLETKNAAVKPSALHVAKPLAPGDDLVSSVIELDGDIFDNPAGAPDDWDTLNCDTGNATVKTGVLHDGLNVSIFTQGGSKDPNDISQWRHTDGSVPDKDELINAYAARFAGIPNGDDILAFGADRFDNSGTAFIAFWFFKSSVFPASDGRFRTGTDPSDPLALHQIGDVLVLVEFTNGGAVATAKVFEWVATGGSEKGGTLNDITATAPIGSVFSISNGSPQTIPGTCTAWDYTPKSGPARTISVNSFFEGAINLDAFPALNNSCFSSFMVETRSSADVNAQLKDFVLGQFNTCPEVSITKTADDNDVCAGTATTYTYTVHNPTGFTLSGTVVDDNETPANAADDLDVTAACAAIGGGTPATVSLPPGDTVYHCTRTLSTGSHTNTVTVNASFGGFSTSATDDETVTVHANPDMSIDNFACNTSGLASTLTATDANNTGATLSWTRNGNAFAGNVTSIQVTLPGVYIVTATTADGCTDTASRTVGICTTCAP